MADNSPPPQIRRQIFGHPTLRTVRAPEINIGGMHSSGGLRGGGGSAMARGFGTGAESGDPVFTGNFEHNPTITFGGLPLWGGGLSDRGKEQKAQSEQIQKFLGDYASTVQNGSSQQDAFRSAVQGNGGSAILNQLMMHPTALRSMENLNQFLAQGQPQGPAYTQVKGADGKVYQIARDPGTGQVIGQPEDIGLPGTPAKTPAGKGAQRTSIGPDGTATITHGTVANGIFTPGTTGAGQPDTETRPPTLGEVKAQQAIAVGKTTPALTPYSGDPVPTATSTKHPLTQGETTYLANSGNFISDLKVARDYANAAGPVSGTVSYVGGKYLGLNDQGATYAAALNRLDQGVYAQYGIKGSAGAKQLMATLPTHSEAPSYVKATLTAQISNAAKELQSNVDLAEQRMGMPLPGTLKTQLEQQADVYPLSDQHLASSSWVARNYPDKLTGQQALELSHRTDLEPDAAKGLDSALDTQAARRMQDQRAAAQQAAAQQQTSAQRAADRTAQAQVDSGASTQPGSAQQGGQGAPGSQGGLVSGLAAPGGTAAQPADQTSAGAGTGSQPQQGSVGSPAAPQSGNQDYTSGPDAQGQGASMVQPAPAMAATMAPGAAQQAAAAAPAPQPAAQPAMPPAPPPVTPNATTGTLATPSTADDIARSIASGMAGGM